LQSLAKYIAQNTIVQVKTMNRQNNNNKNNLEDNFLKWF